MKPRRRSRHAPHRLPDFRQLVFWCLLVVLPCHGLASAVTALLGPNHTHREVASAADDPMRGWVDFRRAGSVDLSSIGRPSRHVHSHSIFQRHHHDVGDATVVALDGAADDGGASTSDGSGCAVWASTDDFELALSAPTASVWQVALTQPLRSRDRERIDRPPRFA